MLFGDTIKIETIFKISKNPKIKIHLTFIKKRKKFFSIAEVNLVIIRYYFFYYLKKAYFYIENFFKIKRLILLLVNL